MQCERRLHHGELIVLRLLVNIADVGLIIKCRLELIVNVFLHKPNDEDVDELIIRKAEYFNDQ